jgi:hypothetical protein
MTPYQIFLIVMLPAWPLMILGILMLMSKLEERVERNPGRSPEEAGLEPAEGGRKEKEVTIVFDGDVVSSNADPTPIRES